MSSMNPHRPGELDADDLARIDEFLYDVGAALSEWVRQAAEPDGASDACVGPAEREIVEDVERLRDEVVSMR